MILISLVQYICIFFHYIISFSIDTPDRSVWHTLKWSNSGEIQYAMPDGKWLYLKIKGYVPKFVSLV